MCFEGLARLSRRVRRRFVRGSREISLVPSLHRASTDALIGMAMACTYSRVGSFAILHTFWILVSIRYPLTVYILHRKNVASGCFSIAACYSTVHIELVYNRGNSAGIHTAVSSIVSIQLHMRMGQVGVFLPMCISWHTTDVYTYL